MARQLKWWVAVPLGACALIALALMPPRGMPLLEQRYFRLFQTVEPPTPYRARVQELADRYRATALELRLLDYRERLRPEIARRRALEIASPALLIETADTLSDSARSLARALVDTAWSRLGLGVSKISVGVVVSIEFSNPRGTPGEPAHRSRDAVYLLPDSSDRTTCIAFLPITYYGRPGAFRSRLPTASPALEETFRSALGPCAYYAAFGSPGRPIAHWLSSRQFDLAKDPWDMSAASAATGPLGLERDTPWFWGFLYRNPATAVACLAARREACREAVLAMGAADTSTRLERTERLWWQPTSLVGANRYFADLADDIGRERFGRFWNSELPVDTALAAALRMPVGDWTRRWQATIVPPIRLGPAAPSSAMLLAGLLALAAVVVVALTATRREVR